MIIRDALNGFNRPQWRPVTGSSRVVLPEGPVLPEGQRESSHREHVVVRVVTSASATFHAGCCAAHGLEGAAGWETTALRPATAGWLETRQKMSDEIV